MCLNIENLGKIQYFMKLFINDTPINILKIGSIGDVNDYEVVLGSSDKIKFTDFKDDILVIEPSFEQIDKILKYFYEKKSKGIDSITLASSNFKNIKSQVKKQFNVVKAAGGLVLKDGKFLLIHRIGKWDLPKGKLEKGETTKAGAVREVEEECNIKVSLGDKIVSTWHSYTRNNKKVIKKTTWYVMFCLDDSKMAPQVEEDIDDVHWMPPKETNHALYNSYPSIRYVFQRFYKMQEQAKAYNI